MDLMRGIEGWLSDAEAFALYRVARACGAPIVGVEIGSWHGKSSVMIGGAMRDGGGGALYAIDPYEGAGGYSALKVVSQPATDYLDRFQQNIAAAGLGEIVRPMRGYSYDIVKKWTTPTDLLFIDGDHDYGAVRRDFEDWSPHLKPGGITVFHDTNGQFPGPTRLVEEELRRPDWVSVRCVGSLTIARKAASI
jgi:predicted O-methyltransferase YrrM